MVGKRLEMDEKLRAKVKSLTEHNDELSRASEVANIDSTALGAFRRLDGHLKAEMDAGPDLQRNHGSSEVHFEGEFTAAISCECCTPNPREKSETELETIWDKIQADFRAHIYESFKMRRGVAAASETH